MAVKESGNRHLVILLCMFGLLIDKTVLAGSFKFSSTSYTGRILESTKDGENFISQSSADQGSAQNEVAFDPQIQIEGGLACQVKVVHRHGQPVPPFTVSIADQNLGLVSMQVSQALNCEERRQYSFELEAISCSGEYSERIPVDIFVDDVNEFDPEWTVNTVSVSVEESNGQTEEIEVVRVQAVDVDCGPNFSKICRYEMQKPTGNVNSVEEPFIIDDEGIIKAIRPLNASEAKTHVLSVVAEDCGGRRSSPLVVVIEVRQPCKTGWKDISLHQEYTPGTGPQPTFPTAKLHLCPEDTCIASKLTTTVYLRTGFDGDNFGCDRDTYSLESQRSLCGADSKSVELLSGEGVYRPNPGDGAFLTDDEDPNVVRFDGGKTASGIEVTDKLKFTDETFPGKIFSISTWMRHGIDSSQTFDKHRKEHIICRADDRDKNRHHMALFVRNCKLILLLRREHLDGGENVFRPAEWRWKMPQVCDDEWHHYSVNVNFPNVELVVDGDPWITDKANPEIIDDWPLHSVPGLKTRIDVGACWQGSENRYRHEMNGYLAGLSYLPGGNENLEVLKCVHQCAEALQVPAATQKMESGSDMLVDRSGTKVILDATNATAMEELLKQVAYLNAREFPSPGERSLTVSTKLECDSDQHEMHIEQTRTYVNVAKTPSPKIEITGTPEITKEYFDFKTGLKAFWDVEINKVIGETGDIANPMTTKLRECSISVSPALNSDHEKLEPYQTVSAISYSADPDGVVLRGIAPVSDYNKIMKHMIYYNTKPAYYLNRQFRIKCTDVNKRFASNDYVQTIIVNHPPSVDDEPRALPSSGYAERGMADKLHDPKLAYRGIEDHFVDEISFEEAEMAQGHSANYIRNLSYQATNNNIVAVIAVGCVCFLAILLIMGIMRIRTIRNNSNSGQQNLDLDSPMAEESMAWDDAPLHITVNPMTENAVENTSATPTVRLAAPLPPKDQCQQLDDLDDDLDGSFCEEEDEDDIIDDSIDEDFKRSNIKIVKGDELSWVEDEEVY